METSTVYCTACNRHVQVTQTPAPLHSGEANLGEDELVCLTYSPCCPPEKCPVANLPSVVMGVRLARSGMTPEKAWRTIRMHCDGCDGDSELEVLDSAYAFCPTCGTTSRLPVLH